MKTAVFVDGANIFNPLKLLGLRINYEKLRKFWPEPPLVSYYTATLTDEETGLDKMRSFMDWLEYNHIRLVTKQAKSYTQGGQDIVKGNLDIELAVDAMEFSSWATRMVFFTGDDDFVPVLRALRARGVYCIVCGHQPLHRKHETDTGAPVFNHVANDLRRVCDEFWNISDPDSLCAAFIEKENRG